MAKSKKERGRDTNKNRGRKMVVAIGATAAVTVSNMQGCGPEETGRIIHQNLHQPVAISNVLALIGFPEVAEATLYEPHRLVTFVFKAMPDNTEGVMVVDDRDGEAYPVRPILMDGQLYVTVAIPASKGVALPNVKFMSSGKELAMFKGQFLPGAPIATFFDLASGGSRQILEDHGGLHDLSVGKPHRVQPDQWEWLGPNTFWVDRLRFTNLNPARHFALRLIGEDVPLYLIRRRAATIELTEAEVPFELGELETVGILPALTDGFDPNIEIVIEEVD